MKSIVLAVVFVMTGVLCFAQTTISNAEELNTIVRNSLSGDFIQARDFSIDEFEGADYENWNPIGSASSPFRGTYDGAGFTISGLSINRNEQNQALFGATDGATIKNLGIVDADIRGSQSLLAILIANAANSTIINCFTTGDITSFSNSQNNVAGLIARVNNSLISYCYSDVTINSRSSGQVGGLAGYVDGTNTRIENSYTIGSVIGRTQVGGFVANLEGGIIINCYTHAAVESSENFSYTAVGGFVSINWARIDNSYSTGQVIYRDRLERYGGFVGLRNGTCNNVYYNIDTSGVVDGSDDEVWKRNTDEMTYPYDEETYENWDFDNIWVADTDGTVNNGYPYLKEYDPTSPYPTIAKNPQPLSADVSLDLEHLSWQYIEDVLFTNPDGFRVYMNNSGVFQETDDYEWVPFVEQQETYILELEEQLNNFATYYWKVVPTNENGDAEDIPVWSFTTELIVFAPEPTLSYTAVEGDDFIKLEWDEIEHADYYVIYSSANPYTPFRFWSTLEMVTTNYYYYQPTSGNRRFFRIIAGVSQQ